MNTQTQHTPGPWRWEGKTLIGSNDCFVDKDDLADARLIAAAADLLAICEEIANDSKCDLVNSERRIRLYSAIRKAKGEA